MRWNGHYATFSGTLEAFVREALCVGHYNR
jgi:hypothetical protein